MQNLDDDSAINELIVLLKEKMENDNNITPTLNNIHDALLRKYPYFKQHSEKLRTAIVKNLKKFNCHKDYKLLFIGILLEFSDKT